MNTLTDTLIWGSIALIGLVAFCIGWRLWGVSQGILLGAASAVGAMLFSESIVMLGSYVLAGLVGWLVFVLIDDLLG